MSNWNGYTFIMICLVHNVSPFANEKGLLNKGKMLEYVQMTEGISAEWLLISLNYVSNGELDRNRNIINFTINLIDQFGVSTEDKAQD
ncbi:2116_t:CDS:2 [Acaulospora morrowiae]|uniref:2116_t:CDS:1 n=1 Tax=Acaulospora morrowiae TaxID=94023 RepID=A0A9N9H1N1_9GLOM|nr:2116_t:CDS:2 [Acaulospora morrowiae]